MDCPQFPPNIWPKEYIDDPTLFKSVKLPADFGDDVTNPPKVGEYRNVILTYEANNHTYIYSSDGIPVLITGTAESGGEGTVKSVNSVEPDTAGNVTLVPSDIGAPTSEALSAEVAERQEGDSILTGEVSGIKTRLTTTEGDIDTIEGKIPAQASSSNQLADKDFVNSSVATNTANYISDNGQPFASLADLQAYSGTLTNNDYAFVVGTDSAGNTTYTRYKYVANQQEWAEEYVLNNSSFTANQWASINSGITQEAVEKLAGIPADAEPNTIDSISVNGTAVTPDANKNVDLTITSPVKQLTSADANYPATNPDRIYAWKLPTGVYVAPTDGTPIYGCLDELKINFTEIMPNSMFQVIRLSTTYANITYQTGTRNSIGSNTYLRCTGLNPQLDSGLWGTYELLGSYVSSLSGALANSQNRAPSCAAVTTALANKQDTLTFDTTPTQSSTNPVTSGGVFEALNDAKPLSGSTAPTTSTEGTLGQTYVDTSTGNIYYLSEIDETTTPATYTWEKIATGTGVNVVQTTGTSTTDVMSQNATTKMVYADNDTTKLRICIGQGAISSPPSGYSAVAIGTSSRSSSYHGIAIGSGANATSSIGGYGIAIGYNAETPTASNAIAIGAGDNISSHKTTASGAGSIAIGRQARALHDNSIALGAGAETSVAGEMNIGTTSTSYGYNNSNYRLLTGVYDPQSAHDAATKGYVDNLIANLEARIAALEGN